MIQGWMNSRFEAVLPLTIYSSTGQAVPIEAVIDTGFSGDLTLPISLLAPLGLPSKGQYYVQLADGSSTKRAFFAASVDWLGSSKVIEVLLIDSNPLVGMNFFRGSRLTIEALTGGTVKLDPIP